MDRMEGGALARARMVLAAVVLVVLAMAVGVDAYTTPYDGTVLEPGDRLSSRFGVMVEGGAPSPLLNITLRVQPDAYEPGVVVGAVLVHSELSDLVWLHREALFCCDGGAAGAEGR